MGPKRRCHVCKERIEGPSFKFPTIEAKRTMWAKSLEIDEPKKFGSKGPSIYSEHFDRKSLKRTSKGGWRLSEGAKPLHIVSSRTGFEENMYLVSNRGKVAINIRENLCQKLNFCNNRKYLFRLGIFITLHNAYIDLILAGTKHEVNRCLAIMSSRFLRDVLYHSQNQHEACTVFFDDVKERTVSLYLEALNKGKRTLKFFIMSNSRTY